MIQNALKEMVLDQTVIILQFQLQYDTVTGTQFRVLYWCPSLSGTKHMSNTLINYIFHKNILYAEERWIYIAKKA